MPPASNLQIQEYEFQHLAAGSRLWRWRSRVDLTGSAPAYQVVVTTTPFGPLRDTTPIPGDVIQAMAASLTELVQNFPPQILVGPPTTLTFTVDEGRGWSTEQTAPVENSGPFGSLLNITATSNQVFCRVTPSALGGLARDEVGNLTVSVNSLNLLSSSSPYSATVTVADSSATNGPITIPVSIIVRPKATVAASPITLNFTVVKPVSGPFPAIATQTFTTTNTGPVGSVLAYQITRLLNVSGIWLQNISPVTGSLTSGGSQAITITVAPEASLAVGTYSEVLRVSGYSTNNYVDVTINLTVT